MRKKHNLAILLIIAVLVWPASAMGRAAASPASAPVTVDNFTNGETLHYDLPLLKGTALNSASVTIMAGSTVIQAKVNGNRWRSFVPLLAGTNTLIFTTPLGYQYSFTLNYVPSTNGKLIRLVYPLASNSPGTFDAPVGMPNTLSDALPRVRLAGRILQSMMAELLYEKDVPRKTFRLETAANGSPIVDVPRSPLSLAQIRSMSGGDLWSHYYNLFSSLPDRDNIIDITIMGDSHYDAATGTLQAHTALGGGRLALFANDTLYSWPETADSIEAHFSDTTTIEGYLFPEYGRAQQYWATYTTSLGAVLHETGHSLSLAHPTNPTAGDIMWRGFDYLNRLATTCEPTWGNIDPATDTMPRWTNADLATLQANSWLANATAGGGAGGPVLLPGTLQAVPRDLTYIIAKDAAPAVISQTITVDIAWHDLSWTASASATGALGINLSKLQGQAGESLDLWFNPASYDLGVYTRTVTLVASDNSIVGSPLSLPVNLVVVQKVYTTFLPSMSR